MTPYSLYLPGLAMDHVFDIPNSSSIGTDELSLAA